jgi:hypothetical protein
MKQGHLIAFGSTKPPLWRITSVLIILFIAATTQAQSLIPELSFKNPVLKTGRKPGDGLMGLFIFSKYRVGNDAR